MMIAEGGVRRMPIGPKRDDPERRAKLLEAGRANTEKRLFNEALVLKRQGAKATDLVRATRKGHRAQVGVFVSEDGDHWSLRLADGQVVVYHKSHCEHLQSKEAGKAIRKIRQEMLSQGDKPYGDGDI